MCPYDEHLTKMIGTVHESQDILIIKNWINIFLDLLLIYTLIPANA